MEQQYDRRQGPRRGRSSESLGIDEQDVSNERRGPDRRKGKPGIAGLLGAIFGSRQERTENGAE